MDMTLKDTLETEQLILRPVNEADFDAVHSWARNQKSKIRPKGGGLFIMQQLQRFSHDGAAHRNQDEQDHDYKKQSRCSKKHACIESFKFV